MNTEKILKTLVAGDYVGYEINGKPRTYEGEVLAVGPESMTVLLDTGYHMGVRFSSIDYVTLIHAA